jgi:hypothetical protein
MCLCLNCFNLKNCNIYYWIEKQHKENSSYQKNFFAYSPIIIINEFKNLELEYDIIECLSYALKPGHWIFDFELVFFSKPHDYM